MLRGTRRRQVTPPRRVVPRRMLSHEALHPRPRPRRLTRQEYHRLGEIGFFRDERVELIHGMVIEMGPIGPPHADVVDFLTDLLVVKLGDLLDTMVVRRERILRSWLVVGAAAAKNNLDDVVLLISAIKAVICRGALP